MPSEYYHKRSSEEKKLLWTNYIRSGSLAHRDSLFAAYLDYSKSIAHIFYGRFASSGIQKDDCIQLASLGLLRAIKLFKPSAGVKFETYAAYFIRGEILNGISRYSEEFNYASHKRALERERARSLGSKKHKTLNDFIALTIDLSVSVLIDDMKLDSNEVKPFIYGDRSESELMNRKLLQSIDGLHSVRRQVIYMHYFYDQSFSEISRSIGLSKSRIAQIHRDAIKHIGKKILDSSRFQMVI